LGSIQYIIIWTSNIEEQGLKSSNVVQLSSQKFILVTTNENIRGPSCYLQQHYRQIAN
jgi:hypothetical protein